MAVKSKSRKPRSAEETSPPRVEERIRRRGDDLYEQCGRVDGFTLSDWLEAESEVRGTKKQPHRANAAGGYQC